MEDKKPELTKKQKEDFYNLYMEMWQRATQHRDDQVWKSFLAIKSRLQKSLEFYKAYSLQKIPTSEIIKLLTNTIEMVENEYEIINKGKDAKVFEPTTKKDCWEKSFLFGNFGAQSI